MPEIIFLYNKIDTLPNHETIAKKVCELTGEIISLPDKIEIEFTELKHDIYGEIIIHPSYKRRIRISSSLSPKEIIYPIVHELIHLHQIQSGILNISDSGVFTWAGKEYKLKTTDEMTKEEYHALPWEEDVVYRQPFILDRILSLGLA